MHCDLLKFIFNENEYIKISLKNEKKIIDCCSEASMILNIHNKKIIISKSTITYYIEQLQKKLILALDNQLQLHESITKTPGFYWNQWMNEEHPKIIFLEKEGGNCWIGTTYFL